MKAREMAHPALVVGLIAIGGFALKWLSKKQRIFVSYYYRDDNKYKNLLTAWSENKKFEIEFEDGSADISVKSKSRAVVRRVLSRKIREADVLLVLVGEKSHRRSWIAWELKKAKELRKRIVAVKIKPEYQSPKELLSAGAIWAHFFSYKSIKRAIEG